ncbi:MAG: hypothetical protein RI907_2481 [Pseudomonadota bacterium]|jgi:hypothetical protein
MLRWPLPALLTWALCWALARALQGAAAPGWAAWALPLALGAALSMWPRVASTGWRQVFVALGFPLSWLASGQGAQAQGPAWAWLLPLGLLLLAYPVRAWRDAPVFPTPPDALAELPRHVRLRTGALVLDAGCGLGDGLVALHRALSPGQPDWRLHGVEHSWLWWAVCAWRCRDLARVRRGDMWADDWAACDLVYLFQRPETMPRAWAKACAEMRPGSWLLSLEFEARDAQGRRVTPHAHWRCGTGEGGKPVWLYRVPESA